MPGIAVIISRTGNGSYEETLSRMVASMRHEPFYHAGNYIDRELGLYIGWVCHPNSYGDGMPLRSADGNLLLFLHGEHRGEPDASTSENAREVLSLFERHGADALTRLNGWYHGVLIDRRKREVLIFIDRFGMQRLHRAESRAESLFASEAKALLSVRPELRRLDPRGLGEFLSCGCVLENRSLFSGVVTLPAATALLYSDRVLQRDYTYFSGRDWEAQAPLAADDYKTRLIEGFSQALNRCLNSTAPVAISLTGGFDTRMIMAWIPAEQLRRIPTYTFGGMYRECFDVQIARRVAEIAGCTHQVFELGDAFLKSYPALAERTVRLSDGCLGATNAYELYLNGFARQVAPVRITGSYGSEVMRGARAFKAVHLTPGLLQSELQEQINRAVKTFTEVSTGHAVSFSVFKQAPWFYYNRLVIEQSQVAVRTPYMDNDFVGLVYRRPAILEEPRKLARYIIAQGSPALADLRTDTGNCSFPVHVWSQFLFKVDYCYKSGMPQWLEKLHHFAGPFSPEKSLIGRHRFAHFRVWFRNQLAPYVREILLDRRTASRPYFNHRTLEAMIDRHIKGVSNHTDDIEKALTVELTCRQFLEN